jgi:hypothetical protein
VCGHGAVFHEHGLIGWQQRDAHGL